MTSLASVAASHDNPLRIIVLFSPVPIAGLLSVIVKERNYTLT
jgi:hypothetical protein